MKKNLVRIIGATLLLLGATASEATLINNGDYTTDTGTGLEWLDLTKTGGQSYGSVTLGFGGYVSAGWRYATGTEVAQLFFNAGATGGGDDGKDFSNRAFQEGFFDPATLLLSLLGQLDSADSDGISIGLIADNSGDERLAARIVSRPDGGTGRLQVPFSGFYYDNDSSPGVGSFLVRASTSGVTVPEPGTFALLGLALAGLPLARRRRMA